jgi:hypothetical protein
MLMGVRLAVMTMSWISSHAYLGYKEQLAYGALNRAAADGV